MEEPLTLWPTSNRAPADKYKLPDSFFQDVTPERLTTVQSMARPAATVTTQEPPSASKQLSDRLMHL